MKADVVIMDGEMLDALSKSCNDWRKKYEGKVAENITLSKKVVDLTAWQEEADKLIWKMIKENNDPNAARM